MVRRMCPLNKSSISSFFHLAGWTQNTDAFWRDLGATAVVSLSLESVALPILCLFYYSWSRNDSRQLFIRPIFRHMNVFRGPGSTSGIQEPFRCTDQFNWEFSKSPVQ